MKLPHLITRERSVLTLAAYAAMLLVSGTLHAGIIATDSAVPLSMNSDPGTAVDPSVYIIGNASEPSTVTHSGVTVIGSSRDYNQLRIQNGWTLFSNGGTIGNTWSGLPTSGDQAHDNTVTVTGTGSAWVITPVSLPPTLAVGRQGKRNKLIVQNNAVVTGSNTYLRLGSEGGANNSVLIETGGRVTVELDVSIGHASKDLGGTTQYANNNQVTVTGIGSTLITNGKILVGNTTSTIVTTGNYLTIEDGALVKASASTNPLTIQEGNFLQLDGGYLALKISQGSADALLETLLSGERIQVWDDNMEKWVTALSDNVTATYYATDTDASAATGYQGLGGYTIITSAIPEAGTVGLLLIGFGSLVYIRRRKGL